MPACGLGSLRLSLRWLLGTGVRVSAGGPGLLREEAARLWPCLSGLSDPGTRLQTALRPLQWMPRSLVASARGLRRKLRQAEAHAEASSLGSVEAS